jgi:hypothetical protein
VPSGGGDVELIVFTWISGFVETAWVDFAAARISCALNKKLRAETAASRYTWRYG